MTRMLSHIIGQTALSAIYRAKRVNSLHAWPSSVVVTTVYHRSAINHVLSHFNVSDVVCVCAACVKCYNMVYANSCGSRSSFAPSRFLASFSNLRVPTVALVNSIRVRCHTIMYITMTYIVDRRDWKNLADLAGISTSRHQCVTTNEKPDGDEWTQTKANTNDAASIRFNALVVRSVMRFTILDKA